MQQQVLRTCLAYSNKSRLETLDNRRCASLIQALQTLLQGASPLTRTARRCASRGQDHATTDTGEHETMPFLRQGAEPLDKLIAVRLTATEQETPARERRPRRPQSVRVCPAASFRAPRPGPDGRGDGA